MSNTTPPAAGPPYQPGQQYPPNQPQYGQPYPGQQQPGQPYPGQPYPGQPQPGQPYPGQPYPGQPQAPYGQPYAPGYQPAPTGPQRNNLVFVLSILMLIGAFFDIIAAFGLIGLIAYAGGVGSGVVTFSVILVFLDAIYLVITGVTGIKNAANPAKGGLLFNLGIGLCVISLISMILTIVSGGNVFSSILGFVLPVLFVWGAMQLKKQAG